MPDHAELMKLLEVAGPLAATSANRSGEEPSLDAEGARAIFGDEVGAYLAGVSGGGVSSTVVDVTRDPPAVLRAGPIII